MLTKRSLLCAALGAVAATGGALRPAHACGGFFCSQTPVDQTGEEIIFAIDDTSVIAHIRISYSGAAKDFSWVVPVSQKPDDIALGSQAVFTQVTGRTQPRYQLNWNLNGGFCGGGFDRGGAPVPGTAQPPSAPTADKGVMVLDEREVGPFETVVIESKDATALTDWLSQNGYQQPPQAFQLIEHYVNIGMVFVALKMKKDAMAGEIQPLVLKIKNPEACVPLILTRIAALPDMPVTVFTVGKTRVFPRNWFEVQVNQKKIDWFQNGTNYRQLVTQALDEAGGRGFVTEYAGTSAIMREALYRPGQYNLDQLRATTDPVLFVNMLLQMGFPRDQTMQALLRKYIPMPDSVRARGVDERSFYNNLAAYRSELGPFDPAAFVVDLDLRIIKPLVDAQAMFDGRPYLTRLLATISPDEMTRDPLFHFNADLPKVSNVHFANLTGTCLNDGSILDASIHLETGETIDFKDPVKPLVSPNVWAGGKGEPAARTISLVGPTGKPVFYTSEQAKAADKLLDQETPEIVRGRPPAGLIQPPPQTNDGGVFSCTLAGPRARASGGLALVGLALVGGGLLRRRRRR